MVIGFIIGIVIALILLWANGEGALPETVLTLALVIGVVSCNRSEWYQEGERQRDAEQAAKDKAEATPRVIREADGCKVYTFKAGGHWHYYTRCASSTVTESHRTESTGSGKTRKDVDVVETISQSNT